MFEKYLKKIDSTFALQYYQILRYTSLIIISVLLSKSLLSIENIGVYESFLLVGSSLSFFWVSGLVQALLGLYGRSKALPLARQSEIFYNSFLLMFFIAIVFAFLFFFISDILVVRKFVVFSNEFRLQIFSYLILSCPANLLEYFYLLTHKYRSIIVYATIAYSVQIILIAAPAFLGFSVHYCLWGLVLVWGVRFVCLLIFLHRNAVFKFSLSFHREYFIVALPLIVSLMFSGSAQYIDGFIVKSYFDDTVFAVFRYGTREFPFIILMASAFSNAVIPDFCRGVALPEVLGSIRKRSLKLMHLLFPVSMVLLVVSRYLFPVLFSPMFAASASVFNIYVLLVISRMVFPQSILIGLQKNTFVMQVSLLELIINVVLSLLFVRYWGIEGIAAATFVAFLSEKVIMIFYLKIKMKINFGEYTAFYPWLWYSVATFVVYFLFS